jgi:wyosine [tRNA(Phe)-imidazoG37] synthetase (radical SAM superfamily)
MSTQARLDDLAAGVVTTGPQTLHIDVTNGCNTNCITCWDHSPHLTTPRSTAWKKQKIDVIAVKALLDDVSTLDTDRGRLQNVIVSGMGEPFTHPGIYEIIADIKRRGLHLTIITNLVAADVDRVVALGVDALLVGVQGASEASYLAFHPNFSSWHWQTLQRQLAVLSSSSVKHKQVQVVCRQNAHELVAMIAFAKSTGADQVNFKLASLKDGTEAVALTSAQVAELLAHDVAAAAAEASRAGLATNLPVFAEQLRRHSHKRHALDAELPLETAPIDEVGCFLGGFYSRVTVDGTILFCCNTDVVIGSLATLPFSAWWRSARWTYWRRRMREGRYLASCFQCGKFNQNESLSTRFRDRHGEAAWRAVTGRGDGNTPCIEPPPRSSTTRSLVVLP